MNEHYQFNAKDVATHQGRVSQSSLIEFIIIIIMKLILK